MLKPVLSVDINTGTVAVSGKPGASVQLQDKEGNPVGSPVTLNAQGQGVIPLPQSTSGESLEAVQTSDGVKSPTSDAVVVPTLKPVVGAVDPQTGKVAVEGKPGATVQLKDAAGNAVGAPVTLNAQGKGELQVPPTLSGQEVAVTQTVGGVESLPSAGIEVPLLKPTLGVPDANTGTVAVSGKPGASVQLQDKEGNPVGSPVTLNAQGQGVIPLPQSTSGESLEAVQTSDGVKSPASDAVVVPTLKPVVGAVDPQTGKVAVEGKPGATVQLKDAAGNAVGAPVTLNAQGKGELQVPPTLSGQEVAVTQTVGGVESLPSAGIEVPLLKPTLGVPDANTGTVAVSGKPGASVQLQDKEGNPVGSPVTLNAQGQGVIPLPQSTSGESLEAVQTSDGVKSPASDAVVVPTLKPVVGAVDPQTGKVAVEGKPGATVQLKDAAGNAVGAPVTLNAQGKGELQVPPTLSGQEVAVTQTVGGVESLPSAGIEVPLLKPTLGVPDANTGTVAVSGKPGASVQLQDKEGNPVGSPVTLNAQGQGVIPLPQSTSGESLEAVQTSDGVKSPASDAVVVPTLKPVVGAVDPQTGKVAVEGKPGATVQLKDAAGNAVGAPVTLNAQGQGELQVPPTLSGQEVAVTQTVGGVESLPSAGIEVPLLKPTLGVPDANTGTVAVSGKPGASVQLQDKEGNPVGSPVTLNAQGQGVIPLPQSTSGESLEAVQTSDGVKSPASDAVVVPTLKPVVGAVDPQTGKVAVEGKPGATVQLKDAAGNAVGAPVTLNAQGKGELQVPPTLSGQEVAVTQTVGGVESLPSAGIEVPLLKPTLGVPDANTGTVAVSGKPGASVQLQDKEGNPVGSPVTLNAQGQGVIPLPQSTSGESLEAVQTSDGVKSPASDAVVVPTLKPVVGAVDPQTGKVAVEGKPGATVQLKDAAGNAVGAPVTLNAQGKGELQVPPTLSGQEVAVTQTVGGVESLPSAGIEVPLLKPTLGVPDANTGTVAVSGKPGASVQLQDKEGNPVGSPVTLNAQGQGVIPLPQSTSGESLEAVQTSDGVKSPASDAVVVPTLKPVVGAVDPQTGKVAVEGKPGATVQLKDAAGNAVGAPVTLNAQGQGELQVPPTLSGQEVAVTQTVGGVESLPSAGIEVPLLKPTLGVPDANTGTVVVSGKPGASVQLQDKEGNPVGSPVTLNAQGQGVIPLPQSTSGESLEAVQTSDGVKSPTSDAVVVPTLKPVVGAVDPQNGKVAVEGKPGATVQLKDAAGNAVGAPVTLNAQGKGELQVPPTLSGQEVAVTQTVGGVESLPSAGIEVPLLKPTLGVPDANTGTVAVSGKPGASVQLQDEEGNPVGSPVTLNAQGQGVIQIPPSLSGQVVTVIQKLNDLQSPPSDGVSIPLLKPTVLVDADSGELLVSGKPNASVQLLDKNNNPIGSPVQLDAQGQAVIKLPHSLGGESVGVVAQEAGGTSAVSTLELPLLAPVFGEVDALSGQVSVEGKPEGIVRIEKPDGTFIRVPLDENGKGSVILPSSVSSENLEATVRLGNLESVPGALAVPVLAPRGAAINDTGSTVTVKAKPGEIIKVRDAGGKELGSGVVGKDGSVEIALSTPQKTGAPLSVTAHNQGEVSPTVTVVTPFIDADLPLPPTELSINPAVPECWARRNRARPSRSSIWIPRKNWERSQWRLTVSSRPTLRRRKAAASLPLPR